MNKKANHCFYSRKTPAVVR